MATELELGLPLTTLDRAISVLVTIHDEGRPLTRNEMASVMGVSPGTGSLNDRAIAAKRFGLAVSNAAGVYTPTPLGQRLACDPLDGAARMQAVLFVDAFRRLEAQFGPDPGQASRGDLAKALERLGVAAERAWKAAYAFKASWPSIAPTPDGSPFPTPDIVLPPPADRAARMQGRPAEVPMERSPVSPPSMIDRVPCVRLSSSPVVVSLLESVPWGDQDWSLAEREEWLALFASAVRFLRPVRKPRTSERDSIHPVLLMGGGGDRSRECKRLAGPTSC